MTGRESDKFMLRLPDGMRDRIKSAADKNNRSMNAEIVGTLEAAYPRPLPKPDLEEVIALVAKDGEVRVLSREGSEIHVTRDPVGRVVLQVIDSQENRDI